MFFIIYNDEKFKHWKKIKIKDNIVKDVRNLVRLKKEVNDIKIK